MSLLSAKKNYVLKWKIILFIIRISTPLRSDSWQITYLQGTMFFITLRDRKCDQHRNVLMDHAQPALPEYYLHVHEHRCKYVPCEMSYCSLNVLHLVVHLSINWTNKIKHTHNWIKALEGGKIMVLKISLTINAVGIRYHENWSTKYPTNA